MQNSPAKLNWTNILFFTILPLVAVIGTIWLCLFKSIAWQTWLLAGIYMIFTGLAITAGYHRLLAHKSFRTVWPVRLLLLLFGAGAFQGSALEWCSDHRNHHRYTDTDKDPYNIQRGFWYAHMGWLFYMDAQAYDFSNVEDLKKDKLIMWQHNNYLSIAIVMGFVLPMALAMLWGNPLGGLIIAGALRMTLNHHFTFAINSVSHTFGNRTYSNRQSACDNWFTALITYGEGFHNFHHQFPIDYRNGVRFYHYDPTKWLIKGLAWLGLANDLKKVTSQQIIRYRLQMQETMLANKLTLAPEAQKVQFKTFIQPYLDNIYQTLKRLEALEKEYLAIRQQKKANNQFAKKDYYKQLKTYQMHFKNMQKKLKTYLESWEQIVRNY